MNAMTVDDFHATVEIDADLDLFREEILGLNGGADFYGKNPKRLSKYLEDPRHFDRMNSPKKWRLDVALPGESKVRPGSVKRSIAFYLARFAVRFATKRMVNQRREGDGGS